MTQACRDVGKNFVNIHTALLIALTFPEGSSCEGRHGYVGNCCEGHYCHNRHESHNRGICNLLPVKPAGKIVAVNQDGSEVVQVEGSNADDPLFSDEPMNSDDGSNSDMPSNNPTGDGSEPQDWFL